MTIVSVNRAFQTLRSQDLIVSAKGQIEILNGPGLVTVAEFDPHYLHFRD